MPRKEWLNIQTECSSCISYFIVAAKNIKATHRQCLPSVFQIFFEFLLLQLHFGIMSFLRSHLRLQVLVILLCIQQAVSKRSDFLMIILDFWGLNEIWHTKDIAICCAAVCLLMVSRKQVFKNIEQTFLGRKASVSCDFLKHGNIM